MRQDAELHDVSFVDAANGWAVGDRGAIWHTSTGGQQWQLQDSGVDCRLESVQFLDAKHGWAAGGMTQPYTHTTVGVLLHTRDGGQTWKHDSKLMLPAFARVKFFDAQQGWAITQPSGMFPAGVFTTEDGGRSWSALPAGDGNGWLTGDFLDAHTGALAGRNEALASVPAKGSSRRVPTIPACGRFINCDLSIRAMVGSSVTVDWCCTATTAGALGRRRREHTGRLAAALRLSCARPRTANTSGLPARRLRACCRATTADKAGSPRPRV